MNDSELVHLLHRLVGDRGAATARFVLSHLEALRPDGPVHVPVAGCTRSRRAAGTPSDAIDGARP